MPKLVLNTNPKVDEVFANYPDMVRDKMLFLKQLVIETAALTYHKVKHLETLGI